jgi:hypothetical protein
MPKIQKKGFFFVLTEHFFRLKADSQTDRLTGQILPKAIPADQAGAGHKRFQTGGRDAPGKNEERAIVPVVHETLSFKEIPSFEPQRCKVSHEGRNL